MSFFSHNKLCGRSKVRFLDLSIRVEILCTKVSRYCKLREIILIFCKINNKIDKDNMDIPVVIETAACVHADLQVITRLNGEGILEQIIAGFKVPNSFLESLNHAVELFVIIIFVIV